MSKDAFQSLASDIKDFLKISSSVNKCENLTHEDWLWKKQESLESAKEQRHYLTDRLEDAQERYWDNYDNENIRDKISEEIDGLKDRLYGNEEKEIEGVEERIETLTDTIAKGETIGEKIAHISKIDDALGDLYRKLNDASISDYEKEHIKEEIDTLKEERIKETETLNEEKSDIGESIDIGVSVIKFLHKPSLLGLLRIIDKIDSYLDNREERETDMNVSVWEDYNANCAEILEDKIESLTEDIENCAESDSLDAYATTRESLYEDTKDFISNSFSHMSKEDYKQLYSNIFKESDNIDKVIEDRLGNIEARISKIEEDLPKAREECDAKCKELDEEKRALGNKLYNNANANNEYTNGLYSPNSIRNIDSKETRDEINDLIRQREDIRNEKDEDGKYKYDKNDKPIRREDLSEDEKTKIFDLRQEIDKKIEDAYRKEGKISNEQLDDIKAEKARLREGIPKEKSECRAEVTKLEREKTRLESQKNYLKSDDCKALVSEIKGKINAVTFLKDVKLKIQGKETEVKAAFNALTKCYDKLEKNYTKLLTRADVSKQTDAIHNLYDKIRGIQDKIHDSSAHIDKYKETQYNNLIQAYENAIKSIHPEFSVDEFLPYRPASSNPPSSPPPPPSSSAQTTPPSSPPPPPSSSAQTTPPSSPPLSQSQSDNPSDEGGYSTNLSPMSEGTAREGDKNDEEAERERQERESERRESDREKEDKNKDKDRERIEREKEKDKEKSKDKLEKDKEKEEKDKEKAEKDKEKAEKDKEKDKDKDKEKEKDKEKSEDKKDSDKEKDKSDKDKESKVDKGKENDKDKPEDKKESDNGKSEDKKESDKEKSEDKKESDKEKSEDKKESDKEKSEDKKESDKEKSEDKKENDKEKSEDKKESDKDKSEDKKESDKEKSEDKKESDKEKSEDKKENDKEDSEGKKESDKDKSEDKKESDKDKSEDKKESDKDASDKEKDSSDKEKGSDSKDKSSKNESDTAKDKTSDSKEKDKDKDEKFKEDFKEKDTDKQDKEKSEDKKESDKEKSEDKKEQDKEKSEEDKDKSEEDKDKAEEDKEKEESPEEQKETEEETEKEEDNKEEETEEEDSEDDEEDEEDEKEYSSEDKDSDEEEVDEEDEKKSGKSEKKEDKEDGGKQSKSSPQEQQSRDTSGFSRYQTSSTSDSAVKTDTDKSSIWNKEIDTSKPKQVLSVAEKMKAYSHDPVAAGMSQAEGKLKSAITKDIAATTGLPQPIASVLSEIITTGTIGLGIGIGLAIDDFLSGGDLFSSVDPSSIPEDTDFAKELDQNINDMTEDAMRPSENDIDSPETDAEQTTESLKDKCDYNMDKEAFQSSIEENGSATFEMDTSNVDNEKYAEGDALQEQEGVRNAELTEAPEANSDGTSPADADIPNNNEEYDQGWIEDWRDLGHIISDENGIGVDFLEYLVDDEGWGFVDDFCFGVTGFLEWLGIDDFFMDLHDNFCDFLHFTFDDGGLLDVALDLTDPLCTKEFIAPETQKAKMPWSEQGYDAWKEEQEQNRKEEDMSRGIFEGQTFRELEREQAMMRELEMKAQEPENKEDSPDSKQDKDRKDTDKRESDTEKTPNWKVDESRKDSDSHERESDTSPTKQPTFQQRDAETENDSSYTPDR